MHLLTSVDELSNTIELFDREGGTVQARVSMTHGPLNWVDRPFDYDIDFVRLPSGQSVDQDELGSVTLHSVKTVEKFQDLHFLQARCERETKWVEAIELETSQGRFQLIAWIGEARGEEEFDGYESDEEPWAGYDARFEIKIEAFGKQLVHETY